MTIIFKTLVILLSVTTINASTKFEPLATQSFDKQIQKRIKSWENMIKFAEDKKLLNKLKIVNDYFNKISYSSDINNWESTDYWATPIEFLTSGAGDCEDYAIAKYFTLKKLGIKKDKLSLIYTNLAKNNQAHIVLSYSHKPNYIPIILDNVNKKLHLSTKRKDLKNMRVIESEAILAKFKTQNLNKLR